MSLQGLCCLQLKINHMPKWHILWRSALNPFNFFPLPSHPEQSPCLTQCLTHMPNKGALSGHEDQRVVPTRFSLLGLALENWNFHICPSPTLRDSGLVIVKNAHQVIW